MKQMFTKEKSAGLQARLAALTPEEKEKLESVQDPDMVTWFNRTKADARDKKLRTIPGCFYKVRAQGSATSRDCNEMNKFYKRSLVSCGLVIAHSYAVVHFLYMSRLVAKGRTPSLVFNYLPYGVYSAALAGLCVFMIRENGRILNRLDSKYTPIWVRITEQK